MIKLTNPQVSTQDYCWEPVVIALPGKVAIMSRNIDVLGKQLSRGKFITSWNVPPAGSASCITSLCKCLRCFVSACDFQCSFLVKHLAVYRTLRCGNSFVRIVVIREKLSKQNSYRCVLIRNNVHIFSLSRNSHLSNILYITYTAIIDSI